MTSETNTEFTFPVRVYYEDTDAGGVVFYANYLKFFERARTEWLRHLGFEQSYLTSSYDILFVVAGTQVQYKKPAFLDDSLIIKTKITKIGNASINFEQTCERKETLLVHSQTQVCCIDSNTLRPYPIPDYIRSRLLSSVQDI